MEFQKYIPRAPVIDGKRQGDLWHWQTSALSTLLTLIYYMK
jgi:hypothetical protein